MHMHTLHGELLISFISTSKFLDTFSQLNTQWDPVAIFNLAIWVCDISFIAISSLTHNIRVTDFFIFKKRHRESWKKQMTGTFSAFFHLVYGYIGDYAWLWSAFFLNSKFKNMGICSCYGNYLRSTGTKHHLEFC